MFCQRVLALFVLASLCPSLCVTALSLTRPAQELAEHSKSVEGEKQWPYWAVPPPPPPPPQAWPAAAWGFPAYTTAEPGFYPPQAKGVEVCNEKDPARRARYNGRADKNQIDFVYINLDGDSGTSVERRKNMEEHGKSMGLSLKRISAVNVSNIADDELRKLVPCLDVPGHGGTKGLLLSQIKAFDDFLEHSTKPWLAIFEDDAQPPKNLLGEIGYVMHERPDAQVIYMDSRDCRQDLHNVHEHAPAADMSFNVYSRDAVKKMRPEMDSSKPKSYISMYRTPGTKKLSKDHPDCLHDWFNGNLLAHLNIPVATYAVVKSGEFKSTIAGQQLLDRGDLDAVATVSTAARAAEAKASGLPPP